MLGCGAGGAVSEGLDREQVDGIGQGLAVELLIVQCGGCAHGVDEDERGFRGIDAGGPVAGTDAAQMRDVDCGFRSHDRGIMQVGIQRGFVNEYLSVDLAGGWLAESGRQGIRSRVMNPTEWYV